MFCGRPGVIAAWRLNPIVSQPPGARWLSERLNKWPSQGERPCQARSIKDKPRNLARGPVFLSPGELHFHSPRFDAFKLVLIFVMTGQKKKKGVIQTACRLLVTWKTSLSKSALLPLQVFKGTDTLFKVTSGFFFFFFRWSDLKKNSPERKRAPTEKSGGQWRGRRQRYHSAKESMTVAATVYLGRGKREWRVAKGGAGWKRGTDWLAVSWGACLPAGKGHGREQE